MPSVLCREFLGKILFDGATKPKMAPLLAAVELPLELPLAVLAAPHAAGSPHGPPTPHVVATPLGAAGPIIEAAAQSAAWAAAVPSARALPPLVGNHPPKRPWRKEEDALLLRLARAAPPPLACALPCRAHTLSPAVSKPDILATRRSVSLRLPRASTSCLAEPCPCRAQVTQHGPGSWSRISEALPGRIGKQCRERWHNHLTPDVKKEKFTAEEDKACRRSLARTRMHAHARTCTRAHARTCTHADTLACTRSLHVGEEGFE